MTDIFKPDSENQLEEIFGWAVSEGKKLRIRGAGSKWAFGHDVVTDTTIDMSAFSGISLYEPAELVMTAGAGTPLSEIEALLTDNNQQLAFEPPHWQSLINGTAVEADQGTIGGTFATNIAGPRRFKDGSARDHLLGFRAMSGRAEMFKSGGRVVKNVTGYDLSKLICGSFGTLAAMTEVTFKVLPRPEKTWTALGFADDLAALAPVIPQIASSPHEISGLTVLPADLAAATDIDLVATPGKAVIAVRIEGPGPSVEHQTGAVKTIMESAGLSVEELHSHRSVRFWQVIRDVSVLPLDAECIWRFQTVPTEGVPLLQKLMQFDGVTGFADWAGNQVWVTAPQTNTGDIRVIRDSMPDGHGTLLRRPASSQAPVFQPQPAPIAALNRRIKDAFDPSGILNPGRMGDF